MFHVYEEKQPISSRLAIKHFTLGRSVKKDRSVVASRWLKQEGKSKQGVQNLAHLNS
jgi:hypothetical protein